MFNLKNIFSRSVFRSSDTSESDLMEKAAEVYGYPIVTYPNGNVLHPVVVRKHNKSLYNLQQEYMDSLKKYITNFSEEDKAEADSIYSDYVREFTKEFGTPEQQISRSL